MFSIRHSIRSRDGRAQRKLDIRIGLVEINRLILHEETRASELKNLMERIENSDSLWHPIIADYRSLVVLDGMHRVSACRELGFRYMGVALINAMDSSVGLGKWNRIFKCGGNPIRVAPAIEKLGFELEPLSYHDPSSTEWSNTCTRAMARKGAFAVLIHGKARRAMLIRSDDDNLKVKYDRVRDIEKVLTSQGYDMDFVSSRDIKSQSGDDGPEFILIPPNLSKKEIFQVARSGSVFVPKASRFFLPVRPVFTEIPVTLMKSEIGGRDVDAIAQECNQRNSELQRLLTGKKLTKIRGHVTLDRFYQEDFLYIFDLEKKTDLMEKFKDRIVED